MRAPAHQSSRNNVQAAIGYHITCCRPFARSCWFFALAYAAIHRGASRATLARILERRSEAMEPGR